MHAAEIICWVFLQRQDPLRNPHSTCLGAPPCAVDWIEQQCHNVEIAYPCSPSNAAPGTCFNEQCQLVDTSHCPRHCPWQWYMNTCAVGAHTFPCQLAGSTVDTCVDIECKVVNDTSSVDCSRLCPYPWASTQCTKGGFVCFK